MDNRFITFLNLIKTKSYTKTAEKLYISQPTVTHHIQSLENEFKCKIFEYDNKELKLTFEGKLIKDFAEKMNVMYKEFETTITNINSDIKHFTLGTSNNISSFYLLDMIEYWYRDYPNDKLNIVIKDNIRLMEALESGICDFIITDKFFDQTKFEKGLLKKTDYVLICGQNHPLKTKNEILLKDIIEENLYINPKNEILLQNLKLKHYTIEKLKNAYIIENYALIKELVKKNIGISFVPRDLILEELEREELTELNFTEFSMTKEIYFVYHKNSLQEKYFQEIYKRFIHLKQKSVYRKYNI